MVFRVRWVSACLSIPVHQCHRQLLNYPFTQRSLDPTSLHIDERFEQKMRWFTPLDEFLYTHNPFPILAAFTARQNIASDALILHSTELPYLAVPLCAALPLEYVDPEHSRLLWPLLYPLRLSSRSTRASISDELAKLTNRNCSLRPSTDGPILPDLPEPASPSRPNSRRARLSVGGLLNQSLFRYTTGTKDLPHSSTSASSGRPRPSRRTLRRARSISDVPRTPSMLSPSVSGTSNADQDVFSQSSHSNIVFGRQSLDLSRGSTSELSEPASDPYSAHDCLHLPFGEGVLYTEPPKPRNHSLPHSPRVVREMQSFESGLTAKADDNQPRAPMRQRQRLDITNKPQVLAPNTRSVTPYSTSVFDILQIYSGVPLPDTLSEDSNEPTVKLTSTLTVAPKDDPRFVIWGELLPGEEDMFQSTTDLSSGGAPGHRLSRVQNGDTLRPQEGLKTVIMAATIERWIAQLTSELNYEELLNFFLTYRTYISSIDLCHLLICRFHWALESPLSPNEETVRKIVRVRTFIAIRYWLITFFRIDFVPNAALCQVFSGWLNTLRRDPILVALPDALVRSHLSGTLLCTERD